MPNALKTLREAERTEVEDAIRSAEQRTSAEIVCAIATESGRYDRAEAIVGLFVGILFLLVLHLAAYGIGHRLTPPGSWDTQAFTFAFAEQACAVLAGFIVGNVLASYWHGLRRCFVRRSELEMEVNRAAAYVFAARRLDSTREAGGLLIYVSLFEHRVVVLADAGVMQELGQSFLDRLRDTAVKDLKAGQPLAMLRDTVSLAAEELSAALPAQADDVDELPNGLVLIHPRP